MLKIHFGEIDSKNYIFNPDSFFDNTYEDEWITESLSVEMIRDVDKSEVIGPRVIDSPFLGSIPTERLSGGVKTLILMSKDQDHIFNASACGDNCAKWILQIANDLDQQGQDLHIRLGYLMNFGDEEFDIEIENVGIIVHNNAKLAEVVLDNELI